MAPPPPPPPLPLAMPSATTSQALVPLAQRDQHAHTASNEWVDPPESGGWTLALPSTTYSRAELFLWSNYVSPPRGWPGVFASDAALKEYIVKKLGGRRVRLTEPAHPMEHARLEAMLAESARDGESTGGLSKTEALANAMAARRCLGWDIMGGYILYELAQGYGRKEAVHQAVYHAEPHWWNTTAKGLWVDVTPRAHHRRLVLVESAQSKIPAASDEERRAMQRPADRADEVTDRAEIDADSL